jgi:hypothetical protein
MSMLASVAPFAVVTPFDPAIDDDASNVSLYMETRDMSLLKWHVDSPPTVFHVQRLAVSRALMIAQHGTTPEQKHALAFMSGVVRVDNVRTESGIIPQWFPEWCKPGSDAKSQVMTDAELQHFAVDEVLDIGSVVLARANLRPGRPVCFVPQESSALALALKIRSCHRAAEAVLPTNPRSEHSTQQTQTCASDGEKPGDVIATEMPAE